MAEIKAQLHSFILREFLSGENPENLTDATPLITGGILDSLATLRLVSFLEDTFDIELRPEDLDPGNLDSISSIAALVASKRPRA